MSEAPWRREAYHRFRKLAKRHARHPGKSAEKGRGSLVSLLLLTLLVSVLVAGGITGFLERSLRPVITEIAQVQVQQQVTRVLEDSIDEALSVHDPSYRDFVEIQRDANGVISALSANLPLINRIRSDILSGVISQLSAPEISVVEIPFGSLIDSELLWARGPTVKARVISAGTASAEFDSRFSTAGVNQTMHRIWLKIEVPLRVILPGNQIETTVSSDFCIAETIIVGHVPDSYLELNGETKEL